MDKPLTHAQRLRLLLADGRWHSSSDLVRAGVGYRYGAVVLVVRRGRDGQPALPIDVRRVSASHYEYRARPGKP